MNLKKEFMRYAEPDSSESSFYVSKMAKTDK
eukprot:CAMPEP_0205831688 /NCGR_PEP_ID=MMETSP0206-20130828/44788_1 /ASSEMBLY_ACC=CAM_ASM_000279 /TAXON_ID=36767 /ORGANISM="Euplotes focardii, Strain TN1" /LENGTH=30 /DNA_ID= /DNA_START= /DNA_END= /DNA_ORIENTATION=